MSSFWAIEIPLNRTPDEVRELVDDALFKGHRIRRPDEFLAVHTVGLSQDGTFATTTSTGSLAWLWSAATSAGDRSPTPGSTRARRASDGLSAGLWCALSIG